MEGIISRQMMSHVASLIHFWPGVCMEGSGILQSAENVHGHNVQQDIPSQTSKKKEVDSSGFTWETVFMKTVIIIVVKS